MTPTSWSAWIPRRFFAIGQFYADFSQTSDDEVVACLERAAAPAAPAQASAAHAADPPAAGRGGRSLRRARSAWPGT